MIEEVKTLLFLTDGRLDDYLAIVVPAMQEWVRDYTGQSFIMDNPDYDPEDPDSEPTLDVFPKAVAIFIAKAVEYSMAQAGVTSESLGDHSIGYATEYPASMTAILRPYTRIRFV